MAQAAELRFVVVDGHSVLLNVPALAALHRKNRRKARHLLLRWLQRFQDYAGVKVCVAFDGSRGTQTEEIEPVEVRYAEHHQTADALIERAVAQYPRPSEIVVVTADQGERWTIEALGAGWMSPEGLIDQMTMVCPGFDVSEAQRG